MNIEELHVEYQTPEMKCKNKKIKRYPVTLFISFDYAFKYTRFIGFIFLEYLQVVLEQPN